MVSPGLRQEPVSDLSLVTAPRVDTPTYTLDRTTQFGSLIAGLYDSLCAITTTDQKVGTLKWCKAAFPIVKDYFADSDLTKIEISNREQMFLMTDPIANEIRRIYTHEWGAQRLLNALAKSDAELTQEDRERVNFLARVMRGYGYSSFLGVDIEYLEEFLTVFPKAREKLIDVDLLAKSSDDVRSGSFILQGFLRAFSHELSVECREASNQLLREWREYQQVYRDTEKRALSDPAHVWVSLALNLHLLCGLDRDPTLKELHLSRPTSFMIIEDNPLHQMAFSPLEEIPGASIYVNPDFRRTTHPMEGVMKKCYSSPELALASIEEALIYGHNLPNVVLTDIELGRSHINGIALARELDRILKEAGRRDEIEIVVVYSSNIPLYEETIQGLISEGVVDDRRHKVDFRLHELIDILEAKRAKGR